MEQTLTQTEAGYSHEVVEDWDSELTSLVSSNADVIVKCVWMNDAEVTVSAAMNAYPAPITAENLVSVMSDVYQLLANRVEVQEPEEEEEPEEDSEEDPEKEESADQKDNLEAPLEKIGESKADADKQPVKEAEATKEPEQALAGKEKPGESQAMTSSEEVVANHIKKDQNTPQQNASKVKVQNNVLANAVNNPGAENTIPTEVPAAMDDVTANPVRETVNKANPQETSPPITRQNSSPHLAAEITPAEEDKSVEPQVVSYSHRTEEVETSEDQSAYEPLEFNLTASNQANFVEDEEALIGYFEDIQPETDELVPILDVLEEESDRGETLIYSLEGAPEAVYPEQSVQISLNIEEIEDSLVQLTERIQDSDLETTEKVNEILNKIIEVPANLETGDGENIITYEEVQGELEELFTELFDKMGMEYSPELIKSLARLTLKWHLAEEIEKLQNREEVQSPQASGTHEIIKKLLACVGSIKKLIANAGAIGKSALRLYSFNFAA